MDDVNVQRVDTVKITELEEPSKKIVEILPDQNLPDSPSSSPHAGENAAKEPEVVSSNDKNASQKQASVSTIIVSHESSNNTEDTNEGPNGRNVNDNTNNSNNNNSGSNNNTLYPLTLFGKETAPSVVTALARPPITAEPTTPMLTIANPLNIATPMTATAVAPTTLGSALSSMTPVPQLQAMGPMIVMTPTALPAATSTSTPPTQTTSIFFVPTSHALPFSPLSLLANNSNTNSASSPPNNNNNIQSLMTESTPAGLLISSPQSAPTALATKGDQFVDITPYLNLPQKEAARRLGIPTSTLSKKWKDAVKNRKWPYRIVAKLDKEIMVLLHNIPQGEGQMPPEIEASLAELLRKRQEALRPVVIRL
jgi:hypothetical protein